jgi:hypothetical protein
MKKKCFFTEISEDCTIIEKPFSHDGDDFVEVLAFSKSRNRIESIGTAYDDMRYYFNKNYIAFLKDDEIEFVFDINNFDFVNDELLKMIALSNIMDNSLIELSNNDRNLIRSEKSRETIKSLLKRQE